MKLYIRLIFWSANIVSWYLSFECSFSLWVFFVISFMLAQMQFLLPWFNSMFLKCYFFTFHLLMKRVCIPPLPPPIIDKQGCELYSRFTFLLNKYCKFYWVEIDWLFKLYKKCFVFQMSNQDIHAISCFVWITGISDSRNNPTKPNPNSPNIYMYSNSNLIFKLILVFHLFDKMLELHL